MLRSLLSFLTPEESEYRTESSTEVAKSKWLKNQKAERLISTRHVKSYVLDKILASCLYASCPSHLDTYSSLPANKREHIVELHI